MKRWLWRLFQASVIAFVLLLALGASLWSYYHPRVVRIDGVVYGHRGDRELSMDVLKPEHPNGIGLVYMVSGGWRSKKAGEVPEWNVAPLLRRGYTVFGICHVSQPEATIMEIIQDVQRGVRFVRHHADEYGIDPNRIGAFGGSAGGHLSLMLATRGGPGPAKAEDPVDRESSAVQAVAIFYPVTDLLDLGKSTENPGNGGPPLSFAKGFGPEAQDMARWQEIGKECSPLYWIHDHLPPTLIYHGDADTLVPLEQSQRYQERAQAAGGKVKVVVHRGGSHGWLTMFWDLRKFADWFDIHLRTTRKP